MIKHAVTLFEGLNDAEVNALMADAGRKKVPVGTVLLAEGEIVDRLYILESGEVEIRKGTGEIAEILGTIRPGDFFGELAPVEGVRNSVSVVATDECSLLYYDKPAVTSMIGNHPKVAWNIARVLSSRLRASNDALKNQMEIRRVVSGKEIARMNSVVEAIQTVNSSLELDRVLELILQEAIRITDAERGTIYLVDEPANEIWSRTIAGDEISEIRQPMGKGISGYVARTGETVNIANAYEDERFNPEFDLKSGFKTKNILCIPMRNREDKIIGVFQLINKKHGSFDFDMEDVDSLKVFSINAAIAIENSRLAQKMVQSERLSIVGRMAGTIVHDIKNPMSTIRLYAQVLKKKAGNEEASRLVDEMIRQIDRLVNMAQEVLDFSRGVTQMNIQRIEFGQFISDVLTFLERDFEKRKIGIQKEIDYAGVIDLDPEKMTRVILNIAGNAGDAMPEGGTFKVIAGADNRSLMIRFEDNGIGMPENVRRRIFEPFVTYGKKTGTGLGMAIVKKIVDDHHGTIEIESELGKGTRMILTIPLKQKS